MTNQEYIEASKKSGIKVGDTVKVLRKARDGEQGWGNIWNECRMDSNVGKKFEVVEADTGYGFELSDVYGHFYPHFVLELVKDKKECTPNPRVGRVLVRHLLKTPYKATLTGVVTDRSLNIGISLCTPEDNFCRAKGREKSGERAYNNPTRVFFVADEKEAKVLFHSFANILEHDLISPSTVNVVKRTIELTKPKAK